MPTRLAPGGRWPFAWTAPTPRGRRLLGRATAWVPRVSAYRRLAVALTAAGRRTPCRRRAGCMRGRGEGHPKDAEWLCADCPVLDVCREYAVAARKSHGVWGGTTADQRRRLAAEVRAEAKSSNRSVTCRNLDRKSVV